MEVSLWQTVDDYFRNNEIAIAASHLESLLRAETSDRFTSLAELHFTNPPRDVLEHINTFISECESAHKIDVQAVYFEMNGFDVNYDRWYFDSFAYTEYDDDPDNLDWLCDWSSPEWPTFTLTGLEKTQDDFRWYMENKIWEQKTHKTLEELAVLLVMVRFVQLIDTALQSGVLAKSVPVLATAHDFDVLGRFTP